MINVKRFGRKAFVPALHVLLIIAAILTLAPIGWVWVSSFKTDKEVRTDPMGLPDRLHFSNYVDVWNKGFDRYMLNSFMVATLSSIVVVAVSSLAAYAFARFEFPGSNALFILLFLGWVIPGSIKLAPVLTLMYRLDLVDKTLALVLPYSAGVSFSIMMMRAFFRAFPKELEDSAAIDGASTLKFFLKVLLPISAPALLTLFVLSFLGHYNEFLMAFLLINRAEARTVSLGLLAFQATDPGGLENLALNFAAINVTAIPVIVVYVLFQRHFVQGLTAGAFK